MPPTGELMRGAGTLVQVARFFSDRDTAQVEVTCAVGITAKFLHQALPFFAVGANAAQPEYLISYIVRDLMRYGGCQIIFGKFGE